MINSEMFSQFTVDYDHKPLTNFAVIPRVLDHSERHLSGQYSSQAVDNHKMVENNSTTNETEVQMKNTNKMIEKLNQSFVKKSINEKDFENFTENEKVDIIRKELDRIPYDQKRDYRSRGIRLMNAIGEYAYYCKICENPISSLISIEKHFETKLHQRLENRETLMNLIRKGRHPFPAIGLQFIIEYNNRSLNEIVYKCSFCHIYRNANQMYSHLFDFKHRINLLNNLEEANFESITENELNRRMEVWNKNLGMGRFTKSKDIPDTKEDNLEQLRAIFGSYRPNSIGTIEGLFSVCIQNQFEAQNVIEIIEALKNSSFKYYSHKNDNNFDNS